MLEWLIGTLMTAFPFILPVIILLIGRVRGYRWPIQRVLTMLALAAYAAGLFFFSVHTWTTGIPESFFLAFYGKPLERDIWCMLGYGGQFAAVVALLFAVNWRVIRLYSGEEFRTPKEKEKPGEAPEKPGKAEEQPAADPAERDAGGKKD